MNTLTHVYMHPCVLICTHTCAQYAHTQTTHQGQQKDCSQQVASHCLRWRSCIQKAPLYICVCMCVCVWVCMFTGMRWNCPFSVNTLLHQGLWKATQRENDCKRSNSNTTASSQYLCYLCVSFAAQCGVLLAESGRWWLSLDKCFAHHCLYNTRG